MAFSADGGSRQIRLTAKETVQSVEDNIIPPPPGGIGGSRPYEPQLPPPPLLDPQAVAPHRRAYWFWWWAGVWRRTPLGSATPATTIPSLSGGKGRSGVHQGRAHRLHLPAPLPASSAGGLWMYHHPPLLCSHHLRLPLCRQRQLRVPPAPPLLPIESLPSGASSASPAPLSPNRKFAVSASSASPAPLYSHRKSAVRRQLRIPLFQ